MEIRIQSPQPAVVNGEPIQVELTLRNTGAQALTLPELDDPSAPQPYFVIQGPSAPKPYRFHWQGKPPKASATPGDVTVVAPGQTVQATLSLPSSLALATPGMHALYATYAWQGVVAESNRIAVKVDAPGPPLLRIVGRTPLLSEVGIQALSVQGQTLYLASFHEERPDLGEVDFLGFSRLATAEPGATDFFAPWCQTARPGEIGPRFGWRSGNSLTVAGFHKLPQRIDLGFAPRVHGPSLMAANGDIELLVSDTAGSRIFLLRFPNVGYDQAPPPAVVVWRAELPEPVIDLVASINPDGMKRALLRHAGRVRLMAWDDAGPKFEAPLPIAGRPAAEVGPALHLSVSGVVRASVLSQDPANARKVALTQITWPAGAPPQVVAEPAIELQSPLRSGTIAYSMRSVETPRRDWVFVLESHRVLNSQSEGKAFVSKRQVMLPPQVLVMKDLSYDLEVHARPELNLLQ